MRGLEERLGHRFGNRALLEEALRHASLRGGKTGDASYQRLEYLGDAVLSLCIAEETFRRFPDADEGGLSKARSAVINNRNLVRVGQRIGIPDELQTDSSVRHQGGGVTRKMVADAVEAIAGAIFLDGGYEAAREFVLAHFWEEAAVTTLVADFDAKSRLQEWCQMRKSPLPRYRLLEASGPPHDRTFRVAAGLEDGREAEGRGRTKKEAEADAAERLLGRIDGERTAD